MSYLSSKQLVPSKVASTNEANRKKICLVLIRDGEHYRVKNKLVGDNSDTTVPSVQEELSLDQIGSDLDSDSESDSTGVEDRNEDIPLALIRKTKVPNTIESNKDSFKLQLDQLNEDVDCRESSSEGSITTSDELSNDNQLTGEEDFSQEKDFFNDNIDDFLHFVTCGYKTLEVQSEDNTSNGTMPLAIRQSTVSNTVNRKPSKFTNGPLHLLATTEKLKQPHQMTKLTATDELVKGGTTMVEMANGFISDGPLTPPTTPSHFKKALLQLHHSQAMAAAAVASESAAAVASESAAPEQHVEHKRPETAAKAAECGKRKAVSVLEKRQELPPDIFENDLVDPNMSVRERLKCKQDQYYLLGDKEPLVRGRLLLEAQMKNNIKEKAEMKLQEDAAEQASQEQRLDEELISESAEVERKLSQRVYEDISDEEYDLFATPPVRPLNPTLNIPNATPYVPVRCNNSLITNQYPKSTGMLTLYSSATSTTQTLQINSNHESQKDPAQNVTTPPQDVDAVLNLTKIRGYGITLSTPASATVNHTENSAKPLDYRKSTAFAPSNQTTLNNNNHLQLPETQVPVSLHSKTQYLNSTNGIGCTRKRGRQPGSKKTLIARKNDLPPQSNTTEQRDAPMGPVCPLPPVFGTDAHHALNLSENRMRTYDGSVSPNPRTSPVSTNARIHNYLNQGAPAPPSLPGTPCDWEPDVQIIPHGRLPLLPQQYPDMPPQFNNVDPNCIRQLREYFVGRGCNPEFVDRVVLDHMYSFPNPNLPHHVNISFSKLAYRRSNFHWHPLFKILQQQYQESAANNNTIHPQICAPPHGNQNQAITRQDTPLMPTGRVEYPNRGNMYNNNAFDYNSNFVQTHNGLPLGLNINGNVPAAMPSQKLNGHVPSAPSQDIRRLSSSVLPNLPELSPKQKTNVPRSSMQTSPMLSNANFISKTNMPGEMMPIANDLSKSNQRHEMRAVAGKTVPRNVGDIVNTSKNASVAGIPYFPHVPQYIAEATIEDVGQNSGLNYTFARNPVHQEVVPLINGPEVSNKNAVPSETVMSRDSKLFGFRDAPPVNNGNTPAKEAVLCKAHDITNILAKDNQPKVNLISRFNSLDESKQVDPIITQNSDKIRCQMQDLPVSKTTTDSIVKHQIVASEKASETKSEPKKQVKRPNVATHGTAAVPSKLPKYDNVLVETVPDIQTGHDVETEELLLKHEVKISKCRNIVMDGVTADVDIATLSPSICSNIIGIELVTQDPNVKIGRLEQIQAQEIQDKIETISNKSVNHRKETLIHVPVNTFITPSTTPDSGNKLDKVVIKDVEQLKVASKCKYASVIQYTSSDNQVNPEKRPRLDSNDSLKDTCSNSLPTNDDLDNSDSSEISMAGTTPKYYNPHQNAKEDTEGRLNTIDKSTPNSCTLRTITPISQTSNCLTTNTFNVVQKCNDGKNIEYNTNRDKWQTEAVPIPNKPGKILVRIPGRRRRVVLQSPLRKRSHLENVIVVSDESGEESAAKSSPDLDLNYNEIFAINKNQLLGTRSVEEAEYLKSAKAYQLDDNKENTKHEKRRDGNSPSHRICQRNA